MKIVRFLRNEGVLETLKLIFENLSGILGLKKRKTIFYRLDLNKVETYEPPDESYSIRLIRDFKEIKDLKIIGRLDKDYFRDKLNSGSVCAVHIDNGSIVAYSFIHFREHRLSSDLKLVFDESAAWWGPLFIHKPYRGKKLSKIQLHFLAEYLGGKNIKYLFGSTNPDNYPMISVLLKNHWDIAGLVVIRKLFNRRLSLSKYEFHPDNLLSRYLEIT